MTKILHSSCGFLKNNGSGTRHFQNNNTTKQTNAMGGDLGAQI